MEKMKSKNLIAAIIRWVARIGGVGYLAIFLLFLIGEGLTSSGNTQPMGFRELVGFVFVFVYFAGLISAWKWEGLGGLIALIGAIGWSVVLQAYSSLTLIIVAPALLFLICWFLSRGQRGTSEAV